MLRRVIVTCAALALAQEAERQREIVSESQQTIPYLRSLLCGKVDETIQKKKNSATARSATGAA